MKTNTVSYFMLFLATVVMSTFVVADSPVTTGLVKHVDASALTGLIDGDPVSVWPDLAGYDDMVTYAGEPTYVTGVINGLPVVRFNGDGGLVAATETVHFSGDQPHTVFIVAIGTEYTGSGVSLWQIGRDAGGKYSAFNLEGSDAIGCRMGNGWNKFVPGSAHSLGVADLYVIGYPGGSYTNYALDINGIAASNATNQPTNTMSMDNSTIRVGNRDNKVPSFNGDIAEALFFNRQLSADAENEVGHYLATKYGLTTSYTTPTFYLLDHSPADGAQRVGQDTQLSWDSRHADATPTFKVYLGDDPNDVDPVHTDGPVATTQDTFYVPDTALEPGTLYYYRVAATDNASGVFDSESIVGDIITFTTGGEIAGLYPADGQAGIAKDVMVTWTAEPAGATYITGYGVYFGETLPGTPNATITENQWQAPPLADGTSYQVKVVSLHEGTPVDEATSTFTVGTLVGYWPFDGDPNDTVGDNDGTTTGGDPNFREGVIGGGQAVDFEGAFAQNPVIIPTAALEPKGNWTISCWERSYAEGGGWESFMGCGTDGAGWGTFEFGRLNGNRYVFGLNQGGGYYYTPNNDSFPREVWHYHAISHDAQKKTINWYINGAIAHVFSGTNVTLAPDLYSGNVKNLSQPYNGMIDDFKLYNRPVSLDEVITEYVNGTGGSPILPVPSSGTTGVAWDVVLEWTASGDTTAQVLEIGKEPDFSDATSYPLAADVRTFDVVANMGAKLELETSYSWRVTSTLPGGDVTSTTWLFTVRGLDTDLNGDLAVNVEDVAQIGEMWLDSTITTLPGGSQLDFIDQELWADPNHPDADWQITDYDRYVSPGGPWGNSEFTIKIDPTPGTGTEPNDFSTPSQTLLWTATGPEGTQQLAGINFPVGAMDLTGYDRMGFWVYQRDTKGGSEFRILSADAANRVVLGSAHGQNDKWHNFEWDISTRDMPWAHHFDYWINDSFFTMEFGNFYLIKDGVEEQICLETNAVVEDYNADCVVNLLDAAILGADYWLDASNP